MKAFPVVRVLAGCSLAASLCTGAWAMAQDKVPDAQVESSVLKALADAPELSTQNVQTSTVYGTVTITGNVQDETLRSQAENIVARVPGVKKVVDELTLGDTPADTNGTQGANVDLGQPPQDAQGQNLILQSDGTYAPAPPPQDGQDDITQQSSQQAQADQAPAPGYTGARPSYSGQQPSDNGAQSDGYSQPPSGRQPLYQGPPPQGYGGTQYSGQRAGIPVVVPPGAILRVRINRGIDSQHIKPGTPFDGMVMDDVIADGKVAIPRGAVVTGVVSNAETTKALSGRGELALQITGVQLTGQIYPVQTDVWQRVGRDKTASTVNHGVVGGLFGALVGGALGGGEGAAIGAGVGAGAGVASSAGSPRGDILVPPESILTFHTTAPTDVRTVGEQEIERLSYSAGPGGPAPQPRHYRRGYYPY